MKSLPPIIEVQRDYVPSLVYQSADDPD